ncbi:MAG: autotransporter outer membrane beta-barrel domain-containing protein [Candidatus Omnitrophota bacterium]|jgi:hypothetical protein|nr:MAG: autotransporter outer membrane beta-barrel domain-containing protein [Candidatus Omnitrophota bacterium]
MIVRQVLFIFFVFVAIPIAAIKSGFSAERGDNLIQHAARRYFPLSHSARSLGMGGAWATLSRKNEGITGNPATLDDMQRRNAVSGNFSYDTISGEEYDACCRVNRRRDDIFQGMLGISVSLPARLGKIGIAGMCSEIQTDCSISSDYDSRQISAGWGRTINDAVSLGYGISFFREDEESNLVEYEMDFGYLHRIGILLGQQDKFAFGVVGLVGFGNTDSDLAGGMHGSGDREMLGIRLGASYRIGEVLLLALDLGYTDYDHDADVSVAGFRAKVDEDGDCFDLGVGIEYGFCDRIAGRVGLRYQYLDYHTQGDSRLQNPEYVAPTMGLGIKLSDTFSLDVGVEIRALDETDYMMGVGLTAVF